MNCPQCGTSNPADAKFCGSCGASLASIVTPPNPPPNPGPLPPPTGETVGTGMKVGIAIGSVFVPVLGIVMGIIYLKDPNPEKQKAGKLWLICAASGFVLGCLCFLASALAGSGGGY